MRRIFVLILLSLLSVICTLASAQTTDSASMIIRSGDATDPWKPCWIHGSWGNPIGDPEAKWTWPTYKVSDPQQEEIQIYTRKFNIPSEPISGTLKIAADNLYEVTLNNLFLGKGIAQTYELNGNQLRKGENKIEIKVTNYGVPGSNAETNPAGLIYQLVASWSVDKAGVPATTSESNDPATSPTYKTKKPWYDPNNDSVLQNMISQYTKLREMGDELGRLIGQEADPNKRKVLQELQQKTLDMMEQLRVDIDTLYLERLNQFDPSGRVHG